MKKTLRFTITSLFAWALLVLLSAPTMASAAEVYGYSWWAGHNKKMFISQVYSFKEGNTTVSSGTYWQERNKDFSKFLEVNGYEDKTYDYSRKESMTYTSRSEAESEREDTILSWKRMGYSITKVDFYWSGPR